jgi:hypothetical protein
MYTWVILIGAFIGVPIWNYYASVTKDRLDRAGNITLPKRKRKGPPPPPDHLPVPLVGSMLERRAARKILP